MVHGKKDGDGAFSDVQIANVATFRSILLQLFNCVYTEPMTLVFAVAS